MRAKLILLFLFLLVLILPAQLKKEDGHKKHDRGAEKRNKKQSRHKDIVEDPFFKPAEDPNDDDDEPNTDWILKLQDLDGRCSPDPCLNNGVCEERGKRGFKCDCPKPFKGRRCEKAPKVCKKGTCGRGECVLTSTAPFYECKCKEPFQPPRCLTVATCNPSPCKNGGTCIKDNLDFDCTCPTGFSGRFCHVGPDDCYRDDGESYRGMVSETDDGDECLYWNSHFILSRGTNPFSSYEDAEGLGPHNFCRNPDGDTMPWCFVRRGRKLRWSHCSIQKCPLPSTSSTNPLPSTSSQKPLPSTSSPKPLPSTSSPKTLPSISSPKPLPSTSSPKPLPSTSSPKPLPSTSSPKPLPSTSSPPGMKFSSCGKPQPKRAISRIYGGLKALPGAQPWQLSLQVRPAGSTRAYRHICGAVLIDSCWALTAGHCIDKKNSMQVVAGGLTLNTPEPLEQTVSVEEAIPHENYRETKSAVYNDIALLKLKAKDGVCAVESQLVKAACLPLAPLPDGTECSISGWGSTEDSDYGSSNLLDADVLLISQTSCSSEAVYGSVLDQGMFCAGYLQGGVDSCQGDSGGPLTCNWNGTHVIYGLVSWGDSCAQQNKPGVYTRISHYLSWIKTNMQAS
ncbi:hyaluronan-binding protein 2-like [Hypomesus transpacificus]|uniref:hyaluronan-binding protein 2-like n=1 Tax=Hypomesus transpacificus TaxID=137520 RepID=UPI001F0854AD|nr:hyaluronan-binding protein 2-like [Hypomesus transpacificus]